MSRGPVVGDELSGDELSAGKLLANNLILYFEVRDLKKDALLMGYRREEKSSDLDQIRTHNLSVTRRCFTAVLQPMHNDFING